ncbi:hypothetical protein PybrP1_005536 [[Pythium] brassicae (nom. inval.)]|nr:hypothetical protein PybrP1_005536 [[Pythium] brassicae (nom. inval.)]
MPTTSASVAPSADVAVAAAATDASAAAIPHPPPAFSRLDDADVTEARALGLLRVDLLVSGDPLAPDFGVVYEKRGGRKHEGCCRDVFPSQRALQERCKQLATLRGFQLVVAGSSTRADGGGNVKYRCKKLHGQQYFDSRTPAAELQCPFYINGYGKGPAWKITRACLLHNHYKFIGWRPQPVLAAPAGPSDVGAATAGARADSGASGVDRGDRGGATTGASSSSGDDADAGAENESSVQSPATVAVAPATVTATVARVPMQRNTTLSTKSLCQIVTEEVDKFPAPWLVMARLDGKMIKRLLLSRGHSINHMMASRIKRQLHEARISATRASFQKLASYLRVVADKNPGSHFHVEATAAGVFERALFVPSAALHALAHCPKLVALDHMPPPWHEADLALATAGNSNSSGRINVHENDDALCGVYLTAAVKDANDETVVFALALVVEEDEANWEWFLRAVQLASRVNLAEFTVVAGRTRGLQQALQRAWPGASHRFCVRRLVEEEMVLERKLPVTPDKKRRIFDLARSESETEFTTLRNELAALHEPMAEFLDGLPRANWVKYAFLEAFRKPTFNEVSSDLAAPTGDEELFAPTPTQTSWFGEDAVRSSQPLATFNGYFMNLAANFHARRTAAAKRAPHELVPMRQAQLETLVQGSQRCESIPCANGTYMARSVNQRRAQILDPWRHVNLLDWECTCQEWQDRQLPCVHAIHAAELDRRHIDTLFDTKQNSIAHYIASYAASFTPWPLEATPLEVDAAMKTPLDFVLAEEESGRRKPGPRPKAKKATQQQQQEQL